MYNLAIIAGPTAVGKSAVAVEVAALIGGEIISADSAQVYRGMDIGTAKITHEEMFAANGEFIPHHLLSFLPPDARFSVADFRDRVDALIPGIAARGKIPILVGGTGLYIEGVIDPYKFSPLAFDAELRQKLMEESKRRGKDYLHRQLAQVDPAAAAKIHPNDLKRVIRALEVYSLTGVPISEAGQRAPGRAESRYHLCYIGLTAERTYLYERINQRVDKMMEEGFLEEVKALLDQGYSPDLPALQSLGYRQMIGYLRGEYDLETAVNLIKRDTRRFAKRQLTWFKRDPRIIWFNVQHFPDKSALAAEIAQVISRSIANNVELGISN
ncbi:MAG TPA: tRNA (adenosine(37)-N6)-dimethylallyltransferase MiaA [Clostridia bacterium]|nr:tRNA (adenosine(37)-N6)-dimethylallyltransferase MiaA [Clostridia bacterium]